MSAGCRCCRITPQFEPARPTDVLFVSSQSARTPGGSAPATIWRVHAPLLGSTTDFEWSVLALTNSDFEFIANTAYAPRQVPAGKGRLAVGGTAAIDSNQKNIEVYDEDGVLLWDYSHSGPGTQLFTMRVAIDAAFNVYAVGPVADGVTVLKLDSDGNVVWGKNYDFGPFGPQWVDVHAGGNIAVCGQRTSGITTRLLDGDGDLIDSADHGADVGSVAFDGDGNVVTSGLESDSAVVRKYNTALVLQWSRDMSGTQNSGGRICTDHNGDVYNWGIGTGGQPSRLRRWNADGDVIWTKTLRGVPATTFPGSDRLYVVNGPCHRVFKGDATDSFLFSNENGGSANLVNISTSQGRVGAFG